MYSVLNILALVLLMSIGCRAQYIQPADIIPSGYAEFERYVGDLNNDGLEDCVLMIKKTDPEYIVTDRFGDQVDRNRRGIIVLLNTGKSYQLADQNLDCFSSENEDGGVYFPPDLWIEINDNKMYVHYGHGRYGYWKYTFRYQNSGFELIGYDSSSNQGPIVNRITSINFLTKKKLVKENVSEDDNEEVFKETWDTIEIDDLIQLSDIKDFDELDMYRF